MADKPTPEDRPEKSGGRRLPKADPAPPPVPQRPPSPAAGSPPVGTAGSAGQEGTAIAGDTAGAGPPARIEHSRPAGSPDGWVRNVWRHAPSWLVSTLVHTVLLLGLALFTLSEAATDQPARLVLATGEAEQVDDLEEPLYELPRDIDVPPELFTVESAISRVEVDFSAAAELDAAAASVEFSDFGIGPAPGEELLSSMGASLGDELSGRSEGVRTRLAYDVGATEESELAVAAGLRWIAEHQLYDGGWSFDHTRAPSCDGLCRNPGRLGDARIGATAIALLPFLGAGQTHKTGQYRTTVRSGLQFLLSKIKRTNQGGNLWEPGGRMYSHGLASIVLCEAYAMTQDSTLREPAQSAIDFICYAQDPDGGGWRYDPRQRGDTSVLGWQVMALKSAHMAELRVPPAVIKNAYRFLDSVQSAGGATYGYTGPEVHASGAAIGGTTAVGLLCRMYLGWKKTHPPLQRGILWLSDLGPSTSDMYYNYYATQVMRHWEGDLWEAWNEVMRDRLVNSQATEGHEAGSWYFHGLDLGAEQGGRLYFTAMATMTLEVYYRYLPIYRKQSIEDEFPE